MRKFHILALFFAFFATISAQEPPKGAEKVIITNQLEAGDNYAAAGKAVIEAGFTLAETNKDFGMITTEPMAILWNGGKMRLRIVCSAGKVEITGEWPPESAFGGGSTYQPIQNKGMKGSLNREGFKKMVEVAEMLEGVVSYE